MARKRKNDKQELFGLTVAGIILALIYLPKEIVIIVVVAFIIGLAFFIKSKLNNNPEPFMPNGDYKEDTLHQNEKPKTSYQKGIEYESKIAYHYRSLGYEVEERGKRLGRKDGGIDLIASNQYEILLIQCKNYKPTTKVNHTKIKEFNSNCLSFLNQNNTYGNNIRFLFVLPSQESLKKCAIHTFKDNSNNCRYEIIK